MCFSSSFGHLASSYREEDIQKLTKQKQEWPVAAMFINGSELNEQALQRTFQRCFSYQASIHLAKRFQRRRFFRNQPIRNKNWLWWQCLLTDRDEMSNLYRGHAIDDSYQVSVHWAKWLQRRRFLQKSTNQKQELSVVAKLDNGSGRNESSLQRTCHRCFLPSFGSFGQVVSEEKIFKNRPIRNKNCVWWPCLLADQN